MTDWSLIHEVMEHASNILLYGPPGTGKTYVAVHGGERDLNDVFSVTLTEETPAAELRGHYVPSEGGVFLWNDGPGVAAWRKGGRLVVNEINRGSGDVLTLLYAIADDPDFARLSLPTKETVNPAEGFQIIATMNGDPRELPEALQDRFPVQIEVTQMAPGALEALSEDLRSAAQTSIDSPHRQRVSTRRWRAFDNLRNRMDEHRAAAAVFGKHAGDVLPAVRLARAEAFGAEAIPVASETPTGESVKCWRCSAVLEVVEFTDPRDGDPMCGPCFNGRFDED